MTSRFALLLTATAALGLGACSKPAEPVANEVVLDDAAMNDGAMAEAAPAATAPVLVGGAEMLPTKTIVENASASQDHTTLVAAVKAAGFRDAVHVQGGVTAWATRIDKALPTY